MDNEEICQTISVTEGYRHETIVVDYDTTPPNQQGYPCRGCLQYYDIGCMCLNDRGYTNGICKVCENERKAEFMAELRKDPEFREKELKKRRELYHENPEGKREMSLKRYHEKMKDPEFREKERKRDRKRYHRKKKGVITPP